MIRPAPPACPAGRRDPKSQDFPHSFYLVPADLKIVLVPGEDFEGDGFIVLGLFELFDNSFEIDDPGTDWEVAVFFPEVVIGVDMADPVTIKTDKPDRFR